MMLCPVVPLPGNKSSRSVRLRRSTATPVPSLSAEVSFKSKHTVPQCAVCPVVKLAVEVITSRQGSLYCLAKTSSVK